MVDGSLTRGFVLLIGGAALLLANYISSILRLMRRHVNKKNFKRALHLGLLLAGTMVIVSGMSGPSV